MSTQIKVNVMGIYKKPAFVKVAIQIEEKIVSRNVGVRKRFRAFRREALASSLDCFKWILWNARKRKYTVILWSFEAQNNCA